MANEEKSFQERVTEALESGMPLPNFPDASPLYGLAMAQNEAAREFEYAGFDRKEALYLTAAMFTNNPGQPPG